MASAIFPEEMRTRVFLKVNTIFALAPGVGPIAGSLIDHYLGWQFNFYLLALLAFLLLVALFFGFRETNRHLNPEATKPSAFIRNYLYLFRQPVYLFYVLMIGIGIGVTYSSLVEAPHLIVTELGYSSKMFITVAACIVAAFIVAATLCSRLSRVYSDPVLVLLGLGIMLTGSLAVGLLDELHRVTLVNMLAAISVIYVGIAFVVPVATSRAIAPFEKIVGSASALLGSLSMGFASASTLFVAILPGNSAHVMFIAFTGISGLGVILTVIAFVFWRDQI